MSVSASAKKQAAGQIAKWLIFESEEPAQRTNGKYYLRHVAVSIMHQFGASQKTIDEIARTFTKKGQKIDSNLLAWEDLAFAATICTLGASKKIAEETLSAIVRMGHRRDAEAVAEYLNRNLTPDEAFEFTQREIDENRANIGDGLYRKRPSEILEQAKKDGVPNGALKVLEKQLLESGRSNNEKFIKWAEEHLTASQLEILKRHLRGHWSCLRDAELHSLL